MEAIKKMQEIASNIQNCDNPWDFTHFVRGNLFVLTDSLLTSYFRRKLAKKEDIPVKEIKQIISFTEEYIKFYCKWLESLADIYVSVFPD